MTRPPENPSAQAPCSSPTPWSPISSWQALVACLPLHNIAKMTMNILPMPYSCRTPHQQCVHRIVNKSNSAAKIGPQVQTRRTRLPSR